MFSYLQTAFTKSFSFAILVALLFFGLGSSARAEEKIATFPPLPGHYTSIKIFDNQGRFVGRLLPEKRYWVSIDRIPVFLQNGVDRH